MLAGNSAKRHRLTMTQKFVRAATKMPVTKVAKIVDVTHFSDVLCVWAYIAEARIDALKRKFGGSLLTLLSVLLGVW